jgi:predicted outer membrane repeat protein
MLRLRFRLVRLILALGWVLSALSLGGLRSAVPVYAANATIGDGTPGTCTGAAVHEALTFVLNSGGGNIFFDCGAAPHTIAITTTLQITTGVGFYGGGLGTITLSGYDPVSGLNYGPIFNVPVGGDLYLEEMVVAHGVVGDGSGGCIHSFQSVVWIESSIVHSCRVGAPVPAGMETPGVVAGSTSEGGAIYSGGGGNLTLVDSEVLSSTADQGGGIRSTGSLQISGSRFAGNRSGSAGGAIQALGYMSLVNSLVEHNKSYQGGGVWTGEDSTAIIHSTTFFSNTATGDGGGLQSRGVLTLTESALTENVAAQNGGGLNVVSGSASLDQVVATGNQSGLNGGAIFAAPHLEMTTSQVLYNHTQTRGGGVYAGTTANLDTVLLVGNECRSGSCNGGGMYVDASLYARSVTFVSNTSSYDGGGLYVGGPVQVWDGFFQGNACLGAGCYGGGLQTFASLILTDTDFISNTAKSRGGGAFSGTTLVLGGLFQGNACIDENCRGGGLTTAGSLSVTGTTFIQNSSAGTGGAVQIEANNASRLVNTLFARNSAATSGAALFAQSSAGTALFYVTLAGPGATGAAAIHAAGGPFSMYDTILGDYSTGISLTAGTVVEDYNLFYGLGALGAGVTSGGHSLTGNPAFASPASDNYRLLHYSDAIEAGLDAAIATDFEGDPRDLDNDDFVDIGYDEYALLALFLPLILR